MARNNAVDAGRSTTAYEHFSSARIDLKDLVGLGQSLEICFEISLALFRFFPSFSSLYAAVT